MVPEAFGAIGTAAGLLGFLVGTIDRLAMTVQLLRKRHQYLTIRKQSLETSSVKLQAWLTRWQLTEGWYKPGQPAINSTFWWGKEGAKAVEKRQEIIEQIGWEILALICCPTNEQGQVEQDPDVGRWEAALKLDAETYKRDGSFRTTMDEGMRSVYKGVALALWQNSLLEKRMTELSQSLHDLEFMSEQYCKREHPGTSIPEPETLRSGQLRMQNLKEAMNGVYTAFEAEGTSKDWAFLLAEPEEATDMPLDEEHIELHFLHLTEGFDLNKPAASICAMHSMEAGSPSSLQKELQYAANAPNPQATTLSHSVKSILVQLAESEPNQMKPNMVKTAVARANLAVCIAYWSALLCKIKWLGDICSCRIRTAKLLMDESSSKPGFYRTLPTEMNECCSSPCLPERRSTYLLLGLILAELAIARPIHQQREHGDGVSSFVVREGNGLLDLRAEDLIRRVRNATNSEGYRRAVQYCIEEDCGLASTANPWLGDVPRNCSEKVTKPLSTYFTRVAKHYKKQPLTYGAPKQLLCVC